jgi:hypothetical protein
MVGADALEDPVSIEQTMIEHRDSGLLFIMELAVDIDFHALKRGYAKGNGPACATQELDGGTAGGAVLEGCIPI